MSGINLTLRQIRYFIAVAEAASLSGAARGLAISQSALTTAVRDLERGLGVRLLERSSSGVSLTRDGHLFLTHAKRILASVAEANHALHGKPSTRRGQLAIGVTSLVAGYYLAELLDRYRRAFPDVEIAVAEDEHGFLEHMLINGEVDVAILMLNTLREQRALGAEVLTRSPNRLWLAADHPLCAASEVSLRDVAALPQITLVADGIDEVMAGIWRRSGLAAPTVLRTGSLEAVRSLVATGVGVAVLPDFAYRPWSLEWDRVESRSVRDELPTVDIGLVWRRGAELNWTAHDFIEVARDQSRAKSRQSRHGSKT